jgi:hypothetical protein
VAQRVADYSGEIVRKIGPIISSLAWNDGVTTEYLIPRRQSRRMTGYAAR